jgi:drug/metabolite transporter (DMT)-like permease
MTSEPSHRGIYIRLALVATIWGSTFIGGRIVSAEMSASVAAFGRFLIATAALVIMVLVLVLERGLPRISLRQWGIFVILGALGVAAYALCFMFGLLTVTASRGALIMALTPAATLLGGALFLHEPLTRPRVDGRAGNGRGVYLALRRRPDDRTRAHGGIHQPRPLAAVTQGVLLLGEKLQISMIVGTAMVVSGVWIINRAPAAPQPVSPVRTA